MSLSTITKRTLITRIAGMILLPSALIAGSLDNLPDFGDSAGSVISPEYERRLGKLFYKQVRQYARVIDDAEVQSYIQSLGRGLASHSDNPQQPFKFFVLDDASINAFAGPGGMVGMNSGVILTSEHEGELAAVMAHEITHVTQRHLARAFEEASRYSLPQAAALIGAILIGIANPQAGAAAITGISGLSTQNQINFTRANEEEADRIGMGLLANSGYDPRAMPSFFEKLQQVSRYSQSAAPEFLRTHPLTTSRIADSRSRAENYPQKKFDNSLGYELVQYKLKVKTAKPGDRISGSLRNELEKAESEKDKTPIRYGLAYAYIAESEYALAEQQIKILLADSPDEIAYLLLSAKLETSRKNYDAAYQIFERADKIYPDYRPVTIAYSRALLDMRRAKQAKEILKSYERNHAHDLDTYTLLGQAEAMLGNEIETAIIQAEYYFLAGDTKLAVDKLKFIRQTYRLDYYQEQRVKARMAELEYELELEKDLNLQG